jgi:hypothetical protein
MSFLFGRRPRTNTVDLPKQAKEQISKLDGPGDAVKVRQFVMERWAAWLTRNRRSLQRHWAK